MRVYDYANPAGVEDIWLYLRCFAAMGAFILLFGWFICAIENNSLSTPEVYPPGEYEGTRNGATWFRFTSDNAATFPEWNRRFKGTLVAVRKARKQL